MNWTRGSKQTSAMGLATCSVLAILAASCPVKAQTCPTGRDVPRQTIKIYNDSSQWIFPEVEVGTNNPDEWIQAICKITRTQAKTDQTVRKVDLSGFLRGAGHVRITHGSHRRIRT